MGERRHFIPQRVTGQWQLYGLSPRQLTRLLPLVIVVGIGVLITLMLWGLVPAAGPARMVFRSLYVLIFPIGMSIAWIGLMVIPIADAGRTWWDVKFLARTHRLKQTVFIPRRLDSASLPIGQPRAIAARPAEGQRSKAPITAPGGRVLRFISQLFLALGSGVRKRLVTPGRPWISPKAGTDLLLLTLFGALMLVSVFLMWAMVTDYTPISGPVIRMLLWLSRT